MSFLKVWCDSIFRFDSDSAPNGVAQALEPEIESQKYQSLIRRGTWCTCYLCNVSHWRAISCCRFRCLIRVALHLGSVSLREGVCICLSLCVLIGIRWVMSDLRSLKSRKMLKDIYSRCCHKVITWRGCGVVWLSVSVSTTLQIVHRLYCVEVVLLSHIVSFRHGGKKVLWNLGELLHQRIWQIILYS